MRLTFQPILLLHVCSPRVIFVSALEIGSNLASLLPPADLRRILWKILTHVVRYVCMADCRMYECMIA